MERKDYSNAPTHIFVDNCPYFITASIYKKQHLLKDSGLKELLLDCIQSSFERYQWELHHWVILNNHYHLLGKSHKGTDLPKIIKQIHSVSGYHIKKHTQVEQPIWWNYWGYCPSNEKDYLIHLNYLFNNPVKHQYVENINTYPFSSFHQFIKKQGRENLVRQFKENSDYKNLYSDKDDY
jgi:putative transposase